MQIVKFTYCGNCDTVLLEESQIEKEEESKLNIIQSDTYAACFHSKCESITTETNTNEWDFSKCLPS